MAETLTLQQKTAIENRGGKLLVSAAAGSGKTKVLVDRLLSFINDPAQPANIDEFLIITYTKAAAAELRGKIASKLNEMVAQDPSNKHLQRQMQRLYLAKISTVHSFCADILREYAYRLDIPADFRVADESECAELQLLAMERLLDRVYENAGTDSDFCQFIDTQGLGRDDRQIPQVLLKVYASAKCHLDPEKWLDECISSASFCEGTDPCQTVWGAYLIKDLKTYLSLQIGALEQCNRGAAQTVGMENAAQLLSATISQLQALYQSESWDEIRINGKIDYGRLTFSKNCTDMQLAEKIKAIRNHCKKGLEKKLRNFTDSAEQVMQDLSSSAAAARGLVKLVRDFSREYDSLKQRRRILDFGDLEHKMLDLLLGKSRDFRTAAAQEIEARFCQIMVDEYQDSNEIQDAIFSALTHKRQNCFMVGDVKQSIYQFRLADPDIFIEKYNHYLPAENALPMDGRKVLLSNNFRSSGGVISAVNHVFRTCMSQTVGGLTYGKEEQLNEGIPHISILEPEVELYGVDVQENVYPEEAAFTAQRIEQLLDGTHMVREKDTLRPIRPEDIVILLRSPGSVGGEFRYALEARGIPCTTGDSTDLLQTEEIGFIRSLLQVISNPLQDIPLISVLTSRVFCFTADDLAVIRGKNRKTAFYTTVAEDASEKAKRFIASLSVLRKAAQITTLSQLMDKIFEQTDMLRVYASMPDGNVRTSNIQAFYQIVSDFEAVGQNDLERFLEYLNAMEERGLSLESGDTGSCVTIMSIHKSKGLEFPVVFLCGLSRSFNQESAREQVLCHKELALGLCCVDQKQRVRYPSISKRAIASKIIADGISEELRVLYVAMTRARDRLIMTYAAKNLKADLQDIGMRMGLSDRLLMTSNVSCPGEWVLLSALSRTEAGAFHNLVGCSVESCLEEPVWKIQVVKAEEVACGETACEETARAVSKTDVGRIQQALSYRYPYLPATQIPSKQTATQLKGRTKDAEAAENSVHSERRQLVFREPTFARKEPSGKDFGNMFHLVMQHIDFTACTDERSIRDQIQQLASKGLFAQEYAQTFDVKKLLEFFTSELGKRLIACSQVHREMKFSLLVDVSNYYPEVKGEQLLLQGVVDCFMVEDDGITVIDFKTDRVTQQTLPEVIDRYSTQVSAYALALEKIYKMPVKNTYLYFFAIGKYYSV